MSSRRRTRLYACHPYQKNAHAQRYNQRSPQAERYFFRLLYELRSLPTEYGDDVVDELRTCLDLEVAHLVELGDDALEAELDVIRRWLSPQVMGRRYREAYRQRNEEASVFEGLTGATVLGMLFITIPLLGQPDPLDVAVIGGGLLMNCGAVALRRIPLRFSALAKAALRVLSGTTWAIFAAAGGSIGQTINATLTLSLHAHLLSLGVGLDHVSAKMAATVLAVIAIERNRRRLAVHRKGLDVYLNATLFADSMWRSRISIENRERDLLYGYFTEPD